MSLRGEAILVFKRACRAPAGGPPSPPAFAGAGNHLQTHPSDGFPGRVEPATNYGVFSLKYLTAIHDIRVAPTANASSSTSNLELWSGCFMPFLALPVP